MTRTVIPQTPSLVLATYRPEYEGALARVHGAQTIALAPLSDSETAALVSQLLGPDPSVGALGQTIAERAAGNPFFAEEIVGELADRGVLQGQTGVYVSTADVSEAKVPATLQATIAARIDRLDPKAKRTLSAAPVVGSRFGLDLLNVLDVEPVARWPDHPDHRAVATECALQQALNGGHLPAPTDQIRLNTPGSTMRFTHTQQAAVGDRRVGTLDLNKLRLAESGSTINQSRCRRAEHHPARRCQTLEYPRLTGLVTNKLVAIRLLELEREFARR